MIAHTLAYATSSGCLAGIYALSIYKKIVEQRAIGAWATGKYNISQTRFHILFFGIVALEIALGCSALLFAAQLPWLLGMLVASLIGLLLAGKMIFGKSGCPCFGMSSILDANANLVISAIAIGLLALSLLLETLFENTLLLPILSAILVLSGYYIGARMNRNGISAARTPSLDGMLPSIDGLDLKGNNTILIFISTQCQTCMTLLKYLEKISAFFHPDFKLLIIADGLKLESPAKYGTGYIFGAQPSLKEALRVNVTPSLIMLSHNHSAKFSGIDACNIGIGKILVGSFSIPAAK